MKTQRIEDLIIIDLQTFINLKSKKDSISLDDALEIAAYVAANFMQIIYTKNKKIEKHEINGIFGIISNYYNTLFSNQISNEEYEKMSKKSLELLQNTAFNELSQTFFNQIISESKNK